MRKATSILKLWLLRALAFVLVLLLAVVAVIVLILFYEIHLGESNE